MTTRRLLVSVIGLYPADFRARYGHEVLVTALLSIQSRPDLPTRLAWVARESYGLLAGACREWVAKCTVDPVVRGRTLPDCRLMRPIGVTRAEWGAGLTDVMREEGGA